jgi:hypothetical protein
VVSAPQVLEDDQAQIHNKDGDDGAVHDCDQGTGGKELLATPQEEGCAEEDTFEHFIAWTPHAELQENIGSADEDKGQRR